MDSFEIVPLIAGYSARDDDLAVETAIWENGTHDCLTLLNHHICKDGLIRLLSNDHGQAESSWAQRYYQYIHDRVMCDRERSKRRVYYLEIFLPDGDYCRVKEFLEMELERLRAARCTGREGDEK
ncbi:MAG TPA: hypothetical protein VJZ71_05375 [Phycisphaerae bacterium]|nr:hypothetical protein [Phycisphaerae bacterium]